MGKQSGGRGQDGEEGGRREKLGNKIKQKEGRGRRGGEEEGGEGQKQKDVRRGRTERKKGMERKVKERRKGEKERNW